MLHLGDVDGDLGEVIGYPSFKTNVKDRNIFDAFSSDILPWDRFGWFYGRNGSDVSDGLFEVFTGQDDISKVFLPISLKERI